MVGLLVLAIEKRIKCLLFTLGRINLKTQRWSFRPQTKTQRWRFQVDPLLAIQIQRRLI